MAPLRRWRKFKKRKKRDKGYKQNCYCQRDYDEEETLLAIKTLKNLPSKEELQKIYGADGNNLKEMQENKEQNEEEKVFFKKISYETMRLWYNDDDF